MQKNINIKELESGEVQKERALGLVWNIKTDTFEFKISSKNKPATKRGMLSELSSVYDPLGLSSPFVLKGIRIIQKLCQESTGWDDTVSDEVQKESTKWKGKLPALEEIEIQRCIKPADFWRAAERSIYHFSDAYEDGYGQASYLRLVNNEGVIHCVLLIGKVRLSPLKYVSIPRLELVAATLSVKIALLLREELNIEINKEYIWTDSKEVLGYISNSSKRFKIFVANKIQFIHDHSDVAQWYYVPSAYNQQMTAQEVLMVSNQVNHRDGSKGQSFLRQPEDQWPNQVSAEVREGDPEIKPAVAVNVITIKQDLLSQLEGRISS